MTEHVKVYGVKPRIQYTADGSLTTYEFPFVIFKSTDIETYFGDIKQESNTYTVSGVGNSDGGSVTFNEAPSSGTIITIVRNLSIERTSDFQEGATLRAKVLNDELDYQIACQQQIADNLNRSMVLPPYATDSNVDLTLPTPSAGKAIVWNSAGTNLENSAVAVNDLESTLRGYKTAAESAATSAATEAANATTQAQSAATQAQTATTQAGIATVKATEVSNALSTKVNVALDNLTAAGKSLLAQLSGPANGCVSVTLGSSGVTNSYTAPARGYLCLSGKSNGGTGGSSDIYLGATVSGLVTSNSTYQNGHNVALILPLRRGEIAHYFYGSFTDTALKFVYAQGEV